MSTQDQSPPSSERIKYHAEYHSKINAITLSVQVPPSGLSCRIGPEAVDLIPNPLAAGTPIHVTLPAMIMPTRTTLDPSSGKSSMLTLKLAAMPSMQSLSLSSTMVGEFPTAPLPASQLQGLLNLSCGCCGNVLLLKNAVSSEATSHTSDLDVGKKASGVSDTVVLDGSIHRVVDLPSEHWQELVDCWMCHEEDFTELREGDLGARLGQALVGGTYLLIHSGNVDHGAVAIEEDARTIDVSFIYFTMYSPFLFPAQKPRTNRRPVSRVTDFRCRYSSPTLIHKKMENEMKAQLSFCFLSLLACQIILNYHCSYELSRTAYSFHLSTFSSLPSISPGSIRFINDKF